MINCPPLDNANMETSPPSHNFRLLSVNRLRFEIFLRFFHYSFAFPVKDFLMLAWAIEDDRGLCDGGPVLIN